MPSTVKVHRRAGPALDALSDADRRQVLEAVEQLQETEPDRWSKEKVVRLSDNQPVYLLRASPSLRVFVGYSGENGIEILDIVRQETLERFWDGRQDASA